MKGTDASDEQSSKDRRRHGLAGLAFGYSCGLGTAIVAFAALEGGTVFWWTFCSVVGVIQVLDEFLFRRLSERETAGRSLVASLSGLPYWLALLIAVVVYWSSSNLWLASAAFLVGGLLALILKASVDARFWPKQRQ